MKKLLSFVLVLFSAVLFVACGDKPAGNGDGLVYGVTFNTNVEGVEIERQDIEKGGKVTKPDEIFKVGYKFVAWALDGVVWDFEKNTVKRSIELEAVWELDPEGWEYTNGISFENTDAGYSVKSYTGSSSEVNLPRFYSGDAGIKAVVSISANAFKDTPVRVIDIANIKNIGAYAFYGTDLKTIDLQAVENIGAYAFYGTDIVSVELGENLKTLGEYAFSETKAMNNAKINASKQDVIISRGAFLNSSIKSVTIGSSVSEIGSYAFSGASLESVAFSKVGKLKVIGDFAFYSCSSILNLFIPSGVTHIGNSAFLNMTNLANLVLPSTLVSVHSYAVKGSPNLNGVFFDGEIPSTKYFATDWKVYNVMVYSYSESFPAKAGCWKYSNFGLPLLWENYINLEFDLEALEIEDYLGVEVIFTLVYDIGETTVGYDTKKIVEFSEGKGSISLDSFKYKKYNIQVKKGGTEIYSKTNNDVPHVNTTIGF